ncbi:PspC domain-containing protein [Nocardia sp. NPDC052566]|uniref:PspC domain-containing protein n=1 Tax=Nocardia sp. NPDC052566 TaxID=3364330 RepID=UPI0037C80BC3
MTRTSFGDQLQQMWRTRPVRLPRRGPIAGVAAGFGERYHVDPVLVRVALVVSTIFGGAGIVLYLLAWLLLHEAGDEASAAESLIGHGRSSQSTTKTVVLVVALAIAVSTMGPVGVGLGGSGLISMALLLGGWWMLHLRNPEPPPGTAQSNMFGGLYPDGGINATGYPGAVFPMTMPTRTDAYSTSVYSPYTKLPDAYVPDNPTTVLRPEGDSTAQADADTAVLRADAVSQTGEANTAVLRKDDEGGASIPVQSASGTPTSVIPSGTPSLSKQDSSPSRDNDAPRSGATGNDAGPRKGESGTGESGSGTGGSAPVMNAPAIPAPTGLGTPPSWDPLGVAPLAWDLPELSPTKTVVAPPPPKRPRSRLTPVVIGLAILAAAGAGAIAASGIEWMTPGRIGAVALAVLALGLIAGAFLRRGYGLLVLTAPLAGFVVLASLVGPIDFDNGGVGDQAWAPTTTADLQDNYEVGAGSATLDLRTLNLTQSRTVHVSVGLGDARVLLPPNMLVRTKCDVSLGDQKCPTGLTGEQKPDAPVLDLTVEVGAGNVEVTRG